MEAKIALAFTAGLFSFATPCVLPLVPGYLSAISGISFAELREGKGKAKVLGPAVIFCLSFTVMFVALGMGATGIGRWLGEHRVTLRHISGIVITAMGVLFIATMFIPKLNRSWRPDTLISRASTGGPVIAGLAFAVAWLPCTGPTLAAILTAAGNQDTVAKGGVLLAFYSAGLAIPFILSALAFTHVTGVFRFFRDHYTAITVVSGVILVAMGVLLYTDQLTQINAWMNRSGLNGISDL